MTGMLFRSGMLGVLLVATTIPATVHAAPSLAGTWTLVAADVQHPDGSMARDYGANPQGVLVIDASGNYALQIFKSERGRFASDDKGKGTPAEYRDAVMGASTHYGTVTVDFAHMTLTFHITHSLYANWDGQAQTRSFELDGNVLRYRVPARPSGDVPVSVWRRAD